jgi:ADP-heptose:LPS heptosyltransferase
MVPDQAGDTVKRDSARNVLVYRNGSIGDTVVCIPSLYAIRRHFGPSARIALLYPRARGAVVSPRDLLLGHSTIDSFVPYPAGTGLLSALRKALYGIRVRAKRYDTAVYLAPAACSANDVARAKRFLQMLGVKHLFGFRAFTYDQLCPRDPQTGELAEVMPEARFLLERLHHSGIEGYSSPELPCSLELSDAEIKQAREWLLANGWDGKQRLVSFGLASKTAANWWPTERFCSVGEHLIANHDILPVAVGGPAERHVGEMPLKLWGRGLNAAGVFTPRVSAAALSFCSLHVGVDSGPGHLASAVGTPTVGVHSCRENPGRWRPAGKRENIALRGDSEMDCTGCLGDGLACRHGNYPCTLVVTVDQVVAAAESILCGTLSGQPSESYAETACTM